MFLTRFVVDGCEDEEDEDWFSLFKFISFADEEEDDVTVVGDTRAFISVFVLLVVAVFDFVFPDDDEDADDDKVGFLAAGSCDSCDLHSLLMIACISNLFFLSIFALIRLIVDLNNGSFITTGSGTVTGGGDESSSDSSRLFLLVEPALPSFTVSCI